MRLTVSQPCEPSQRGGFAAAVDDAGCCAPFGTDGTCPVEYITPSEFTLSRARTTAGVLTPVAFFPATVLYCEDALATLVSRSRAEVLQRGNETLSTY